MSLQVDGVSPITYVDGIAPDKTYVDGTLVYTIGGLPTITSFTLTPDKLTVGRTDRLSLDFVLANFTGWTLTETRANGVSFVVGTSTNTDVTSINRTVSSPDQNAFYTLLVTNANGQVSQRRNFTRGSIPVISRFDWTQFRQGQFGTTPDSVLLRWNIVASPTPSVDFSPSIHYHPSSPIGEYRYSRIGTRTNEQLVLIAQNTFGTVRSAITIPWRQEG